MSPWIIVIIAIVILVALPIAKDVISDIDYKRQLSGKIPPRTTASDNKRGIIDEAAPNATRDSISAQARNESFANNSHIINN